jgi:predicted nucleotidyltransferase
MSRTRADREVELRRELERMLGLLRGRPEVRKVILFGSLATGKVGRHSDLDLMVVMQTELRFLDRLDVLYRLLCPRVALEVLAYTEEEFARLSGESRWMQRALTQAQVLYAA